MKKNDEDDFLKKKRVKKLRRKMKYSLVIATLVLFQLSANTAMSQKKIVLHYNDTPLKQILSEIRSQTGYRFFYNVKEVDDNQRISINAEGENIREVLKRLTIMVNLDFKMNENQVVLTPKKQTSNTPILQMEITGLVVDTNGAPLPGANVVEKGTTNGTQTDFDGNFSIAVADENAVLEVSYIGFASKEIPLNNQSNLTITLEESAAGLDEVVVIGYGTSLKSDLTGAVSSVNMDDIEKLPTASITQNLSGRSAGVNVSSNSGAPGAGVTIRIRGTNSLQGNNDPLFVVDGVPIESSPEQNGNFSSDALSGINPEDIESMEILKDASAVAIYGSRGANGVVLITTKSGKAGKARITINNYYGIQREMRQYDVLSAGDFARFRNIAITNANDSEDGFELYTPEEIGAFDAGTAGTIWRDELLREAAIRDTQLSVSGGNENLTYFFSLGNFKQEGVIKGSGFERYSAKISLNGDLKDKLRFGTDLTFSQSDYEGDFGDSSSNSYAGGYIDAYSPPPTFPVRDEDGNYIVENPFSAFPFPNPVENALEITRDQRNLNFLGNVFVEYDITESLKIKQLFGVNYTSRNVRQYEPTFTQRSNFIGRARQVHALNTNLLSTTTLNFDKKLGQHKINGVLGYEVQDRENQSFNGDARDFANDDTGYYSLGSGTELFSLGSNYSNQGLQSFLGRFNYIFDGRYYVTVTGRYDGSSKFQGDNQYSFFPSAALAWRVSNEKFLKDSGFISNLKLRASYGQTGSQAIDPYRTLALIQASTFGTVNGVNTTLSYSPSRIPSSNLKWETTEQYDGGLDIAFLSNKISLTVDYFHKTTSDLLLDFPLPITSGYTSVLTNAGSIRNKGFEFSLNTVNFDSEKFSWDTNFNISFIDNEILDLGGRPFVIRAPEIARPFGTNSFNTGITSVGRPLGDFYVLESDGIIQNQEELDAAAQYGTIGIGTKRFVDQDDNGVIDADDRIVGGNAQPDFSGGLLNNLKIKDFDLSFFWEFSYGGEVLNVTRYYLERPTAGTNVTQSYYDNFFGSDNPNASGTYLIPNTGGGQLSIDDSYVEDGSYARLKNLTLGYSFPRDLVQKLNLSRFRIYANANNLWTITDYTGLDPNINVFSGNEYGVGIDYSAYPTATTFTLGVNLEF
ncbi:TonB-dependent receptor [Maribacter sp. PR1]|uniref:TonB-dependent receptor n=1 Tax=Maribacter cobaltidurans TaxID=1178778 RepID=A0ABU7IXT0_9FLAO|nr:MULTISPECIES: TonB-dependent receptor [Maribacter]MDC6390413.1 TonB-dependent receptor [Maribacter sp. PR1]MEE1977802.1 TonB-dependent receptor [Maribacter cobaltidurans]|tara:strand:- start:870 stop:4289 length:3420 start_codon:yes stop_codon:yes gene_type:complete